MSTENLELVGKLLIGLHKSLFRPKEQILDKLLFKNDLNMYLFFDVSANGKPKNWKRPATDIFNWPRMIHLSWLLYDKDRVLIDSRNHIIQPKGFEISIEAESRHKITPEKATQEGVPVADALMDFAEAIEKAEYVIAHNMNLCEGVVGAEFNRASLRHGLEYADKYCLMQEATWYCKLPGRGGKFKWPSLQDIHTKLYGAQYANAGEAQTDVATATVCFFALLDIRAIELF